MTDDGSDDEAGVPDSDPTTLDPAGDLADLVESGEFDIELADDQDAADLREFIDAVESGEIEADPGVNATVRMARALLEDVDGDDGGA